MNLYIIRHAIAVEHGAPGYEEDDTQRPLTPEGRKKMKKISRGIARLGLDFDAILSSPYVRARQTAQVLVDELKLQDKLAFTDRLIPPGDFDALVEEITGRYAVDNLALVGHEPMLSQLVAWLAGGEGLSLHFRKGGLCWLTSADLHARPRATLEWLLAPAVLIEAGK